MSGPGHEHGVVVWITGLSGVGKSSLARALCGRVRRRLANVVLLDGDGVRQLFGSELGHDPEDRLVNAMRLSRMCQMLSSQSLHVVCATMSLFARCHEWNRRHLVRYYEVLLEAPMEVLRARTDLYDRAARGEERGVAGFDLAFDLPDDPHLRLDSSTPGARPRALASRVIESIPELRRACARPRRQTPWTSSRPLM